MGQLFNIILYQPLLNLLVFFYNILPGESLWLAIILVTIIIKIIIFPLNRLSLKGQRAMNELQPKLLEIRKKYPNNREKQAEETMALYKESKVNPCFSCLPLLIQFPVIIAVFQVFRAGLASNNLPVYSLIANPGTMNTIAFGFLNLAKPNVVFAVLAGFLQYLQAKMLPTTAPATDEIKKNEGAKDENMMTAMNKQMKFMMPFLTVFMGLTLPSGLMIYWITSLCLAIIEQKMILHPVKQNSKP